MLAGDTVVIIIVLKVLRITLPHISLLLVSIGYALAGCWILTAINYKADSMEAMTLVEK